MNFRAECWPLFQSADNAMRRSRIEVRGNCGDPQDSLQVSVAEISLLIKTIKEKASWLLVDVVGPLRTLLICY